MVRARKRKTFLSASFFFASNVFCSALFCSLVYVRGLLSFCFLLSSSVNIHSCLNVFPSLASSLHNSIGADASVRTRLGLSALHLAVRMNMHAVVTAMLAHKGASPFLSLCLLWRCVPESACVCLRARVCMSVVHACVNVSAPLGSCQPP